MNCTLPEGFSNRVRRGHYAVERSAEGGIGMFLEVFPNTFAEEGDCLLSEWNARGSAAACRVRKHRAIQSLP